MAHGPGVARGEGRGAGGSGAVAAFGQRLDRLTDHSSGIPDRAPGLPVRFHRSGLRRRGGRHARVCDRCGPREQRVRGSGPLHAADVDGCQDCLERSELSPGRRAGSRAGAWFAGQGLFSGRHTGSRDTPRLRIPARPDRAAESARGRVDHSRGKPLDRRLVVLAEPANHRRTVGPERGCHAQGRQPGGNPPQGWRSPLAPRQSTPFCSPTSGTAAGAGLRSGAGCTISSMR